MNILHSKDLPFLFNLLNHNSEKILLDNANLFKHQQAFALALFLVDAELATPALDRENVAALIMGNLAWPHYESFSFHYGNQYDLDFYEAGGFISFPGGWAEVHCSGSQKKNQLDQSIEDIIDVTNLLKNISLGWEGYVQPHFVIEEALLISRISSELGNIPLKHLFPSATMKDGKVAIFPDTHKVTQLESTYLWQKLLKHHSPAKAFQQWLRCVRVLSHSIVPVQFNLLDDDEANQFLLQVEILVKAAPEFNYSLKTIYKQSINSHQFMQLMQPVSLKVNLNIDNESVTSNLTKVPDTPIRRTADNLDNAYHIPEIDDLVEIISLGQAQHWRYLREPLGALSRLIQACFSHVIHIDHNSLTIKPFALNLLSMANSRPALKYLLFISLPLRYNSKYILFLLSMPETCDFAIYHLTDQEYPLPMICRHDLSDDLNQIFIDVLIREYIRTIENRADNGENLLKIYLYLADKSGLHGPLNTDNFQHKTLCCFMKKLEDKHVAAIASAFLQFVPTQYELRILHIRERSVYHIGLWLMQRLESVNIDYYYLLPQLGKCLISFYSNAFIECITNRNRDLKADNFFSFLPWRSLIKIIGIKEILSISTRFDSWYNFLSYKHNQYFNAASAICQYLQLLMDISKFSLEPDERSRVFQRIIEIVNMYGFGDDDERNYIFNSYINDEPTNLWKKFSYFVNILPTPKYDAFIERCIDVMPIDSLYTLLDCCNIIERKDKLQNEILSRQDLSDERLGLKSLETAFIHACGNSHIELAGRVISAASPLLERFKNHSNSHLMETIYRWETYRYKYALLSAYLTNNKDPNIFEEQVKGLSLPDALTSLPHNEIVKIQVKECQHFRRYVTAMAFCQTEPSKTVRYMEALYAEVNAPHFAFALFKGYVSKLSDGQNKTELRRALDNFLEQTSSIIPEQMNTDWIAMVLNVMIQVGDQQRADEYWRRLTSEQHRTREILLPYCKGLIQSDQPLVASQIIKNFGAVNASLSEHDLDLTELINQLTSALPEQNHIYEIFKAMAESSQRSLDQLKKHYLCITGANFEEYVQITNGGFSKETFLKKVIIEVAGEVLMRKKNLQQQQNKVGKLNKIIHEDLITDWFTSLVDMRMAEARVGFRDQKRTGSSESGKSPGESDGFITDSKNRRIAFFEAFRLFSLDSTVIVEHLEKISAYDTGALSPVFIVAYCDVKNFRSLTEGYYEMISTLDYSGYDKSGQAVEIDDDFVTDNLWVCTETRLRGKREVLFYHLLLNMYCDEKLNVDQC